MANEDIRPNSESVKSGITLKRVLIAFAIVEALVLIPTILYVILR